MQLGHTIKSPKLSSFFIVILLIIPLVFLNHSKNSFLGVITNYKPLSFSIGCFARISGSSFAFTSLKWPVEVQFNRRVWGIYMVPLLRNWVQTRLWFVSPKLARSLMDVSVYHDSQIRESKISDHSPLIVNWKYLKNID